MLGINSKRTLVSGKFAEEIRERIHRIQVRKLSKEDCDEIRNNRQYDKRINLIWK